MNSVRAAVCGVLLAAVAAGAGERDTSKVYVVVESDSSMPRPKTADGKLLGGAYGLTPDGARDELLNALKVARQVGKSLGGLTGTFATTSRDWQRQADAAGAAACLRAVVLKRVLTNASLGHYELDVNCRIDVNSGAGWKKAYQGRLHTGGADMSIRGLRASDCDQMADQFRGLLLSALFPQRYVGANSKSKTVTMKVKNTSQHPIRGLSLRIPAGKMHTVASGQDDRLGPGEAKEIVFRIGYTPSGGGRMDPRRSRLDEIEFEERARREPVERRR